MKDRLWFLAFVAVLCVTGLVAIDPGNRWAWFAFVIPAAMIVWLLSHRRKV